MRVCSQSFFVSMPEGYGNNKKWKGGNRQMKDKIQPKTNNKGNDKRQKQRSMTKDKDQPNINRQRQNHNHKTKINQIYK